jgi:hypothetical protein
MEQDLEIKKGWDVFSPGEKRIIILVVVILIIGVATFAITMLVKKDTGNILGVVKNFKVTNFL